MSARSESEEKVLSFSILQLTEVVENLKGCKTIKCVYEESLNLVSLANTYKSIWYGKANDNDIVIKSIIVIINSAIDSIETKQSIKFDFSNDKDRRLSQLIKANIEQTSLMLGIDLGR